MAKKKLTFPEMYDLFSRARYEQKFPDLQGDENRKRRAVFSKKPIEERVVVTNAYILEKLERWHKELKEAGFRVTIQCEDRFLEGGKDFASTKSRIASEVLFSANRNGVTIGWVFEPGYDYDGYQEDKSMCTVYDAKIGAIKVKVRDSNGSYLREYSCNDETGEKWTFPRYHNPSTEEFKKLIRLTTTVVKGDKIGGYTLPELQPFSEQTEEFVMKGDEAFITRTITKARVMRVAAINKNGRIIVHPGGNLKPFFEIYIERLKDGSSNGGERILLGSNGYYVKSEGREVVIENLSKWHTPLNTLDKQVISLAVKQYIDITTGVA